MSDSFSERQVKVQSLIKIGDCQSKQQKQHVLLNLNRYELSQCDNAQKPSWQVNPFRKYVGYATAFVKHAG